MLNRNGGQPVYLQLANQLILAIQQGTLASGIPLPGTRTISQKLHIHRKTAIAAIEELAAQGWLEIRPNKGSFVTGEMPHVVALPDQKTQRGFGQKAGFIFSQNRLLENIATAPRSHLELTDGLPDLRLAPLDRLAKVYGGVLRRRTNLKYFGYADREGNEYYRFMLSKYLHATRGLVIGQQNLMTTRGTDMALFLIAQVLLQKGDNILIGELSSYRTNMILQQAGGSLITVPVDENGIQTEAVEDICRRRHIRMLYLTPQHHYPTTVTLSAARRMELLRLARQYGFVIVEDDQDGDFHFHSNALQPLATADSSGMVIYLGSFDKVIAPGFRAGYIAAPTDIIAELGKLRQIVDTQGDLLMEQVFGEMLNAGEIQRHVKKAYKTYRDRRDLFCQSLENALGAKARFEIPGGGLAAWVHFDWNVNLLQWSLRCQKDGLSIPRTLLYQTDKITAMRIGYGNLNAAEMETAIEIMKQNI